MSNNSDNLTFQKTDSVFEKSRRFLFGDDIFISYSRVDSTYALTLANELTKRKLSCFLDQWGTPPGEELPKELLDTIKRCSTMVLIGSENAAESENVGKEVREFLETKRPIIPVTFVDEKLRDNSSENFNPQNLIGTLERAAWHPLISGIAKTTEVLSALKTRKPSENVISRIVNAVEFRSRSKRLRKTFFATLGAIGILVLLGIIAIVELNSRVKAAQNEADEAMNTAKAKTEEAIKAQEFTNIATNKARAETERAESERKNANKQEAIAKSKAEEAKKASELASEKAKIADLEAKRADEETKKAESAKKEADKQQKISKAREFANESQQLLNREPEKINESVLKAKDSMKIMDDLRIPMLESDTALRESLSFMPIFLNNEPINIEAKATALSPNGKYFAALTKDNKVKIYDTTISDFVIFQAPDIKSALQNKIAVSNNGKYLLLADSGDILMFDYERKLTDIFSMPKNKNSVNDDDDDSNSREFISQIAISADGKFIAALLYDPSEKETNIGLWQTDKSKEMITLPFLNMVLDSIVFSSNKNVLAVAGESYYTKSSSGRVPELVMWDISDLDIFADECKKYKEELASLDKDCKKCKAYRESLETSEKECKEFKDFFKGAENRNRFSENGAIALESDKLYATPNKNGVIIWKSDEKSDKPIPIAQIPNVKDVNKIAFSEDGTKILLEQTFPIKPANEFEESQIYKSTLEVWDIGSFNQNFQISLESKINAIAFNPYNSGVLISPVENGDLSGEIQIRNSNTGIEDEAYKIKYDRLIFKSKDLRDIIVIEKKRLWVWDTWQSKKYPIDFDSSITDESDYLATISADHTMIAIKEKDYQNNPEVSIYEFINGSYKFKKKLKLNDTPKHLEITANGKSLIALAQNFKIQIVSISDNTDKSESIGKLKSVESLSLSPKGNYLVAKFFTSDTMQVISQGKIISELPNSEKYCFDSQEKYLVFYDSSKDEIIFLDLIKNKSLPANLSMQNVPVTAINFSSDGKYFAVGYSDGSVSILETKFREEIIKLQNFGKIIDLSFDSGDNLLAIAIEQPDFYDLNKKKHFLKIIKLQPKELINEAEYRLRILPK